MLFQKITGILRTLTVDESFVEDAPRALAVRKAVAFLLLIWPISIPPERQAQFGNELKLIANVAAHAVYASFLGHSNAAVYQAFVQDILIRVGELEADAAASLPQVRERWLREVEPNFRERMLLMGQLLEGFKLPDFGDMVDRLAAWFDLVRFGEVQVAQGEGDRARVVVEHFHSRGRVAPEFLNAILVIRNRLRHEVSVESLTRFIDCIEKGASFEAQLNLLVPEISVTVFSEVESFSQDVFKPTLFELLQQLSTYYDSIETMTVAARAGQLMEYDDLVRRRSSVYALLRESSSLIAWLHQKYGIEVISQFLEAPEVKASKAEVEQCFLQQAESLQLEDSDKSGDLLEKLRHDVEETIAIANDTYQRTMIQTFEILNDNDSPDLGEFIKKYAEQLYRFEQMPGVRNVFFVLCVTNVSMAIVKSYVENSELKSRVAKYLQTLNSAGFSRFEELLVKCSSSLQYNSKENYLEIMCFLLEQSFLRFPQQLQMELALCVFKKIDDEEILEALLDKLFMLQPKLLLCGDGVECVGLKFLAAFAEKHPEMVCKILGNTAVVMPSDKFDVLFSVFIRVRRFDESAAQLFLSSHFTNPSPEVLQALLDRVDVQPRVATRSEQSTLFKLINQNVRREQGKEGSQVLDQQDWDAFRKLVAHPKINHDECITRYNGDGRPVLKLHVFMDILDSRAIQVALQYLDALTIKLEGNLQPWLDREIAHRLDLSVLAQSANVVAGVAKAIRGYTKAFDKRAKQLAAAEAKLVGGDKTAEEIAKITPIVAAIRKGLVAMKVSDFYKQVPVLTKATVCRS